MFVGGPGGAAYQLTQGASFVGSEANVTTSSTMAFLGAMTGDTVVVIASVGSPVLSGGVSLVSVGGSTAFYKNLGAGDLLRTVTHSSAVMLVIYRDAVAIQLVITDSAVSSTTGRTSSGYTKDANHAGFMAYIASSGGATITMTAPATITTRAAMSGRATFDRLYPSNETYVDGTGITWSSTGTGNQMRGLELLRA